MFQMNPGENIQDIQKRFTYLINQLHALGKDYSNEDLINKIIPLAKQGIHARCH